MEMGNHKKEFGVERFERLRPLGLKGIEEDMWSNKIAFSKVDIPQKLA